MTSRPSRHRLRRRARQLAPRRLPADDVPQPGRATPRDSRRDHRPCPVAIPLRTRPHRGRRGHRRRRGDAAPPPPGMVAMADGRHARRYSRPGPASAAAAAQGMVHPRPARRAHLRRCRHRIGRRMAHGCDRTRPGHATDARSGRHLAVACAVPWWASRRRRAKVRLERTLESWPEIARAVGLAGSQVMSAMVDLWGWRARFRLARGQTIHDVIAKIPAIESGLGTFRGAVRVYPTPDNYANRCELRVLDTDPHADAIPWPGPSVTSITEPIDLGPFEDAVPCRVLVPSPTRPVRRGDRRGQERRAQRADRQPVRLPRRGPLGHRPQEGHGTRPVAPLPRPAGHHTRRRPAPYWPTRSPFSKHEPPCSPSRASASGEPTPEMPALVIIIDEYAELVDDAPGAVRHADSIARRGRAVAVNLIAATQRPTQKAMGHGAVRSQMDVRICFRVRERKDVDLILGQGMLAAGWHAHTLDAPGKFLVSAAEHDTPRRGPRLPDHRRGRGQHRRPVRRPPAAAR